MNVGELYINLGVKGAEVATKSLESVDSGMTKVKDTSLEAKAAILAVVYGVEQIVSSAGAFGAHMNLFGEMTSINGKKITNEVLKWGAALEQLGLSSEQAQGAFLSVQGVITKALLPGGSVTPYLNEFLKRMHMTIDEARNVPLLMERFRSIMKNSKDKPYITTLAQGAFGLNPEISAAIGLLNKNPMEMALRTSNEGQVERLSGLYKQWVQFEQAISQDSKNFADNFGGGMVKTLAGALHVIEKLAPPMASLAESSAIIQAAFIAIAASLAPISAAIAGLIWVLGEWDKNSNNQPSIFGTGKNSKMPAWMTLGTKIGEGTEDFLEKFNGGNLFGGYHLPTSLGEFMDRGKLPTQGPIDTRSWPANIQINHNTTIQGPVDHNTVKKVHDGASEGTKKGLKDLGMTYSNLTTARIS